ncbi:MAG: SIS domain-containing protein [Clostridia bacterium]|nr:SIS domain-containing protein [Clostridia bacterium]
MSVTYTEMKSQYRALSECSSYLFNKIPEVSALTEGLDRYVFIGCGSSYSVARSGAMLMNLRVKKPALAIPAGDLLLHTESYQPVLAGSVLVALSRSGQTSEVIRAVLRAREIAPDCRVISVVCQEDTELAHISDMVLEMPWAFDHSVCQTRTVSCLYFTCVYLAAALSRNTKMMDALNDAVSDGPSFMSTYEPILEKAAYGRWTHAVVLGDAELSGLCDEGALAFKEICQMPSNHYHVLDVRHGPMVLIGEHTLVVAVLSEGGSKTEYDVLSDITAKGAAVVTVTDKPTGLNRVIDILTDRPYPHPVRGLPFIAVCQLISFYKSLQTGCDPDKPDGLAPWITLT